ncbi:hypothetical protein ACFSO7_12890 [Bacillus sp. CGMCC 1.16607]|uniref:hypothetical protein n=1 Tax=Bacillus sp. CGMCC 1.16607 TaxID=3351842 RepID=UPI003629CE29
MKIKELILETTELKKLFDFYHIHFGFPLIKMTRDEFTIKIGSTHLTFIEGNENTKPFYHFAINIPESRMNEALKWIGKRVKITTYEGEKVIHFQSWDAHSVYFNDPAGNIVEIIARHQLKSSLTTKAFSNNEFLRIDEIGIPVFNVLEVVGKIKSELGISEWKQPSDTFAAIGDEEGLFIIVKKDRPWFMSDKKAAIFPIQVIIEGDRSWIFSYLNYSIRSE